MIIIIAQHLLNFISFKLRIVKICKSFIRVWFILFSSYHDLRQSKPLRTYLANEIEWKCKTLRLDAIVCIRSNLSVTIKKINFAFILISSAHVWVVVGIRKRKRCNLLHILACIICFPLYFKPYDRKFLILPFC